MTRTLTSTTNGNVKKLRNKYSAARRSITDLASETRKTALDYAADLQKNGAEWVKEKRKKIAATASQTNLIVVDYVRKNPYKALAITAAAGLVAGYIFRGKRRA